MVVREPQPQLVVQQPQPQPVVQEQQARLEVQPVEQQTQLEVEANKQQTASVVVTEQPQTVVAVMPGSSGLSELKELPGVAVREKVEVAELVSNQERPDRYGVLSPTGELLYYASEDINLLVAQQMKEDRGFQMSFQSPTGGGLEAFRLVRQPKSTFGGDVGSVYSGGTLVVALEEEFSCLSFILHILETSRARALTIRPTGRATSSGHAWTALDPDGQLVAVISKKFAGFFKKMATTDDYSTFITFNNIGLPVHLKVALVSVAIIIDFQFNQQKNYNPSKQKNNIQNSQSNPSNLNEQQPQPAVAQAPQPQAIVVAEAPQPQPAVIAGAPQPQPAVIAGAPQPQPAVITGAPQPQPTAIAGAPQSQPQPIAAV